ncbi:hypothetical protein CDAR_176711 [Caerostris darwini]|uniref:Uncharacterized protein n=1 Tax=Caerostris darwini TaxID=1538125 RepID=A0AAV4NLD1_9ARAC|nr:hypothetical protein CDAR_176711 [Caerostris darwini]
MGSIVVWNGTPNITSGVGAVSLSKQRTALKLSSQNIYPVFIQSRIELLFVTEDNWASLHHCPIQLSVCRMGADEQSCSPLRACRMMK